MNPIAVLALAFGLGALLQAISNRRWLAIIIPAAISTAIVGAQAGLFSSGKPDSTATSVFIGFLPIMLALYVGAAALGTVVIAAFRKKK